MFYLPTITMSVALAGQDAIHSTNEEETMTRAIYANGGAAKTEHFFDSLIGEARGEGGTLVLDSTQTKGVTAAALASSDLPESVSNVISQIGDDKEHSRVLDSVLAGAEIYRREHGELPTADVIESALAQGFAAAQDPRKILDSVGSTAHHDVLSAQPNRVVVAITAAIAEAFPAATYLPADINSNEARLAIVSHLAGSTFGGYAQNDIMDGINVGSPYIGAERTITLTASAGRDAYTGQFHAAIGGSGGVEVLRGRTIMYVNGFPCAFESHNAPASASNVPVAGSVTLAGNEHTITGTVTPATGVVSLAINPAFPVGTVVQAEGYIDYEKQPQLTPEIVSQVTTYSLFAAPWRAKVKQTVDSKTQYTNELGLDLASESLIAVRNQFAMERHYRVLEKALALAASNTHTYDFDHDAQIAQKTRAQIWQDFQAVLGVVDQQMAEDTMDHGITHMYVGKKVAAQFLSLPRDLFEPSGIQARPGIYRLGRFLGRFEVYYTPKGIIEGATTSQILCIGRSVQVARCPFVLGDAVPPTYMPLAFGDDMKYGSAFYARNFTAVNPHQPSAKGVALINITNLD